MRRGARGSALLWALMALFAVTVAGSVIGGSVLRQSRLVRLQAERAARADLVRSGLALGRLRAQDRKWRGPETLVLSGGQARVFARCEGRRAMLHVQARPVPGGVMSESVEDVGSCTP